MMWPLVFQIKQLLSKLLMLTVLGLLMMSLHGCASSSPSLSGSSSAVAPPAIPALPSSARQPPRTIACLPTCIESLMQQRESALKRLKTIE